MAANSDLIGEINAQKALMIAVATGGPLIQTKNAEYEERRLRIKAALLGRHIEDPNPYTDLWSWYGYWSSGDLPTYQSRRRYIADLYQPLIDKLSLEAIGRRSEPLVEQTGWGKVDRGVDAIRQRLETAKTEEEFQTVGLLCRETLISLAQAVYIRSRHQPKDNVLLSETDAFGMLDAYFSTELAGSKHEALRRHAKASLALANDLQHRRTAIFRDAAVSAEASRTVVNIVAIISGKRDPDQFPADDDEIPF